jgi:hypothetical protein
MARFSDRLDSANRLIIAAAAIYAGCVTFAHADVYDDMMMAPEHHTAQALSKARALCGKNAARGGYAGDQFVVQALLRSSTDRGAGHGRTSLKTGAGSSS